MSPHKPGISNSSSREVASSHMLLRSAGLMGVAIFLSRILGLVREQIFAIFFGAGFFTDAFNIAFRIPNLLRDLFAEGAMSAALVPTFLRVRKEEGDRRAWRVAGLVFRVLVVIISVLTVAGIFFAEPIVDLYASAFRSDPGKFELTVTMTKIIFPFFPLVVLAAAFMAVLNACGVFFIPALASAMFNGTLIIVGLSLSFLMPKFGHHPIVGMAIGVVAGGVVQAFCQLPVLYQAGYRWTKKLASDPIWRNDPALRKMLWLIVPGTFGMAATQINILVNSILATGEGSGAVSWLNYAFRLWMFPVGVFGVPIATATLPLLSNYWVRKDMVGVEDTLTTSLKHVFAVTLPATAGLISLSEPIVQLVFEYGRFTSKDTANTAMAVAAYSVGMWAYSSVKVLVPCCYALNKAKVAIFSSVASVLCNIALNLALIGPLGFWGLALGTSITAFLNAGFLIVFVRKVVVENGGGFSLKKLLKSFAAQLCIALIMATCCYLLLLPSQDLLIGKTDSLGLGGLILERFIRVFGLVFVGICVVLGVAKLFKVKDTTEVAEYFISRLKNKLNSKEG